MNAKHRIILQGQERLVSSETITGAELRALFGLPSGMDLVVEGEGREPDFILEDYEVIRLRDTPTMVFLRPLTSFGVPD